MGSLSTIIGECRTYSEVAYTHQHTYAQLILPLQGAMFLETTTHCFELTDSRLFFLPPHCEHTFYARNRNEFLVLDIPKVMVPEAEVAQMQGGLSHLLDERWQALRFLLLVEVKHHPATNQNLADLFRYAYRLLGQDRTPRSIAYIHNHFHQSLDLPQLAGLEGYHPTYFCEWFKKSTGLTPKSYIQRLRLEKAKELLVHTDLSILQIAQQVGYEHHASLTRLFQKWEHLTPQAYRQQIRNPAKKT